MIVIGLSIRNLGNRHRCAYHQHSNRKYSSKIYYINPHAISYFFTVSR